MAIVFPLSSRPSPASRRGARARAKSCLPRVFAGLYNGNGDHPEVRFYSTTWKACFLFLERRRHSRFWGCVLVRAAPPRRPVSSTRFGFFLSGSYVRCLDHFTMPSLRYTPGTLRVGIPGALPRTTVLVPSPSCPPRDPSDCFFGARAFRGPCRAPPEA